MSWSLLDATLVTLEVTCLAALVAAVIALLAGTGRLSNSALVRAVSGFYVELFRGTSALVQLYFLYFVLPFAGVSLSPLAAGVLALGLNTGSYGAEIVRGAVQAVPAAQREAAAALDVPRWPTFRHVILPQALVVILPSAGTLLIDLLKLTSLVSLITLHDLTFEAQRVRLATGDTVEAFAAVLVIYFVLASAIDAGVRLLERRARRGAQPVRAPQFMAAA
jgi:polar amino acid transport system permease protein